ncbi:MAG: hypothetical protein DMF38_09380 [Verrucomicrobia bacterium]|nr:MAG: hypothetical protein DME78_00885 [Verrucomicrobiota bacterium]PYL34120.1 MAG: hypothetical protein DMF38_09380 [Verrucomicrobiota bacterium]
MNSSTSGASSSAVNGSTAIHKGRSNQNVLMTF